MKFGWKKRPCMCILHFGLMLEQYFDDSLNVHYLNCQTEKCFFFGKINPKTRSKLMTSDATIN